MTIKTEAELRKAYHAAASSTFETTLRADDAWGNPQSVTVRWRPLAVEGVDAGLDNIDQPPLVWAGVDDVPVCLRIDPGTERLRLIRPLREVTGDTATVVRPEQVSATRRRLQPGEFQIVERTDGVYGLDGEEE